MTETVRVWLVDRNADMRNMVTLTYATRTGDRMLRRQQSADAMRVSDTRVTAATDVGQHRLESVDDPERREWFAAEATRMATEHAPDDEV